MGCICSKKFNVLDNVAENEEEKDKDISKYSLQVFTSLHREKAIGGPVFPKSEGSLHSKSKVALDSNVNSAPHANVEGNGKMRVIERPNNCHQKSSTRSLERVNVTQQAMYRVISMPNGAKAEQVAAGWPSWLASVAGEAIRGWTPRSPDSYEKLNKIGQGTYSSVYRAHDLATGRIVAMKKVRFVTMDPESVRFMAKEICILRRLDHPNVMKLEALVTSMISGSLYLVFEYMEHDLTGLLASPKVKFTEPQIKCYARQMFLGLEHCHSRGVLHRDIKGSNLLVDNKGILKIGDFGLATFFEHDQKQPLTSHVVTLWYRAPELLLGSTQYGVEIDMWSAGCILAELFAGKAIMPGRTEVEQMHKIFKLCGSPTEEYWAKCKFQHATSFKSQRTYKRRVADVFKYFPPFALALVEVLLSIDPELRGTASSALKSEFFTSNPLPCDPSSLPKYPPSKEFDAKLREEEARRRKVENVKRHEAENGESDKSTTDKNTPLKDNESGCHIELHREKFKNGYSHSNAVIHQNAVRYSSPEKGYVPKRNRIFCSGPLMPPGGNMEDMLKEHERRIQEAVRKSRLGKSRA